MKNCIINKMKNEKLINKFSTFKQNEKWKANNLKYDILSI